MLLSLYECAGTAVGSWTHTFSLWCLNPAVVFREIADSCLSVILTSGYVQYHTSHGNFIQALILVGVWKI